MRARVRGRRLFFANVACAAWLASGAARADGSEERAQALFDEGRRLMDVGKIDEACSRFAESQRLDPGGGTLLNLALCHERTGKIATALGEFEAALSLAARDRRSDREELAREHVTSLGPRVPRVMLVVSREADATRLVVAIDGAPIDRASWGTPRPLDPGRHLVEARANGFKTFAITVSLRADGGALGVEIPPLEPDTAAGPPPTPDSAPAHRSALFHVGLWTGVAGYTVSLGTGILAFVAHDNAASKCDFSKKTCVDQRGIDEASRATTMAWMSTISLGIGIAGTVTMLLAPSAKTRVTAAPELARGRAGGATLRVEYVF